MQTLELASTGRQTTRLGFGGSSLMGALGRHDSLALLDAAYDAGVRHFDTAPSYGFGEAEACLGVFLARHAGDVTVTTKFGIPRPASSVPKRLIRNAARAVFKRVPAAKRMLQPPPAPHPVPHEPQRLPFTAAEARRSIEGSLRALRVERIDLLLLHEVEAHELDGRDLLPVLCDLVAAGTLGAFGVGSTRGKIPTLTRQHPAFCAVRQYEWSVLDAPIIDDGSFRIHHRALTGKFRAVSRSLAADASRCRAWSEACSADLAEPAVVAQLLLKAALLMNPASIILFSSKSADHIQRNAALAENEVLDASARQLVALLSQSTVCEETFVAL